MAVIAELLLMIVVLLIGVIVGIILGVIQWGWGREERDLSYDSARYWALRECRGSLKPLKFMVKREPQS